MAPPIILFQLLSSSFCFPSQLSVGLCLLRFRLFLSSNLLLLNPFQLLSSHFLYCPSFHNYKPIGVVQRHRTQMGQGGGLGIKGEAARKMLGWV